MSVPCIGACKGVAGWIDPATGLCCTVCMGSGKLVTYSQRELLEAAWESVRAKRRGAIPVRPCPLPLRPFLARSAMGKRRRKRRLGKEAIRLAHEEQVRITNATARAISLPSKPWSEEERAEAARVIAAFKKGSRHGK